MCRITRNDYHRIPHSIHRASNLRTFFDMYCTSQFPSDVLISNEPPGLVYLCIRGTLHRMPALYFKITLTASALNATLGDPGTLFVIRSCYTVNLETRLRGSELWQGSGRQQRKAGLTASAVKSDRQGGNTNI